MPVGKQKFFCNSVYAHLGVNRSKCLTLPKKIIIQNKFNLNRPFYMSYVIVLVNLVELTICIER